MYENQWVQTHKSEECPSRNTNRSANFATSADETHAERILPKGADGDIRYALRLLAHENTISTDSEDTVRTLQSKFLLVSNHTQADPLRVEPECVLETVMSIQAGSTAV